MRELESCILTEALISLIISTIMATMTPLAVGSLLLFVMATIAFVCADPKDFTNFFGYYFFLLYIIVSLIASIQLRLQDPSQVVADLQLLCTGIVSGSSLALVIAKSKKI